MISRGLKYYDPGWYIRKTPKMSYKDHYEPCELFCPVSHRWLELTKDRKSRIDTLGACSLDQVNFDFN